MLSISDSVVYTGGDIIGASLSEPHTSGKARLPVVEYYKFGPRSESGRSFDSVAFLTMKSSWKVFNRARAPFRTFQQFFWAILPEKSSKTSTDSTIFNWLSFISRTRQVFEHSYIIS